MRFSNLYPVVRRLVCAWIAMQLGWTPAAAAAPPNVLLIIADDLGYADVGFNGGKSFATPNLDRLAATGVNLTNFRACPMCSPTRAGTMTGRWPLRFGMMRAVVPPWSPYGLPSEEQTIPELLSEAGYARRACIGKWHLGQAKRQHAPLEHGFTHFYGHYNGAIDYFTHEREGEIDWHRDWDTDREPGYSTDLVAAEAVRYITESPAGKPWFVYLPFNAPHSPYQALEEDLARFPHLKQADRRAYAAMVESLDRAIGRVLTAVESRADADNTLILFYSDNGGIPKVGSSNAPWRGEKLTVYEGGTRVCAAVRWPAGGLSGGGRFEGRIGYIDVLPTLLAAAGAPASAQVDGIDLLPALRGEKPLPDRMWFSYLHQSGDAHASVHDGSWKLVAHGDFFTESPAQPPRYELYQLADDPAEKEDLSARQPEMASRLQVALREFGRLQRPGVKDYNAGKAGFVAPKDWVLPQ